MATITEDLHVEILLRLPTKSVIRFKSVCKGWRSVISSRRFSVLHTLRHPTATTTTTALLLRRFDYQHYYHLSLCKRTTPLTLPGFVIQSCNGLLLCRYPENAPASYCIYNPATHTTVDVVHNDIVSLAIAFDPSQSAYYKLVCVKAADFPVSPFCYQILVFDSESSSWSIIVENFTTPINDHFGPVSWEKGGVYWNNAIHWNRIAGGLLYFDIVKGTIGHAPEFSPFQRIGGFSHLLVESGGHLHYFISGGRGGSNLIVYEMERDYSNWSIKYEIEYSGLSNNFRDVSVVGIITRTPNELHYFVLFYVSGKLIVYSLISETFRELKNFNMEDPDVNQFVGAHDVHQFVETLAPV